MTPQFLRSPHDDDAAAENAASDDFAVADRDSGADQLLSTAFPDGLSNPFSSAQGGWDVGLQSANSDTDVATGGNPNAFTGGENINPYTGLSTDAANSNSFTGQSSDDSLDDPQNAWSTSGRGGMDTRGMLALKDPLNAGNIATDATMDFSSGQRGGYASAGGTPDTVASNGSVSTPSSHDDKAISNSVNSANLGPDTVGGIRVEQSQPYLLNGIQTIDVVVSSPGSTLTHRMIISQRSSSRWPRTPRILGWSPRILHPSHFSVRSQRRLIGGHLKCLTIPL